MKKLILSFEYLFQTNNWLTHRDGDMRVSLAEFQDPWIRLLQFFVVDPSKEVDVRQLVRRLELLWDPNTNTNTNANTNININTNTNTKGWSNCGSHSMWLHLSLSCSAPSWRPFQSEKTYLVLVNKCSCIQDGFAVFGGVCG